MPLKKPQKITILFPGETPLHIKKCPENQTLSIPYLLPAQPALPLLLLASFCDSTTMCRRNGNGVDPN